MKRQYTETEKRALVAQYATGIAPVQTLAKTAGVSKTTFSEWIHLFGDGSATLSEKEFSAIHFRRVQQLLERKRRIKEVLTSVNCTPLSPHSIKLAEIERLHDENPGTFSIRIMCEALNFKHSTFVNHLKHRGNLRWFDFHNASVEQLTKAVFDEFHQWYGAGQNYDTA